MIIKIQYFPEAKDAKDADASEMEYLEYSHGFEEAIEFVGKLERIEKTKIDQAMLEAKRSRNIPF